MSWSLPRNISTPLAPGERTCLCDLCGGKWLRSVCRRDASGWLNCPECDDGGRDPVTLDRLNAAAGAAADQRLMRVLPPDW